MAHPQILANESIERVVHEGFGEVRQARPAAQFSETPSGITRLRRGLVSMGARF